MVTVSRDNMNQGTLLAGKFKAVWTQKCTDLCFNIVLSRKLSYIP